MFPRWLKLLARLVVFLAALVGYGMGSTMDGDAGIDANRIKNGFVLAALLSLPLLTVGEVVCSAAWWLKGGWRPYHREPGRCPGCDYVLPCIGSHMCPECGTASTDAEREPVSSEELWAAPIAWATKAMMVVVAGCLAAQLLSLLEEQMARWVAPAAFAQAAAPVQTDARLLDNGRWSTQPGMSCRTRYGWVDWHGTDGRTFRPHRWTPWRHIGDLIYVEQPSSTEVHKLFYWFWMD